MPQLDFPDSPTPGQNYVAPNGVTYTYDTAVGTGVWLAAVGANPLLVTPGSISGTASVGATLTYTPGIASGGAGPYTYAYQWKANGVNIAGATGLTYVPVGGDIGKTLTVTITVTDSSSATANATTAPTAAVTSSTIPSTDYNPSPSGGPTASNTVATGTWNGTTDTLSAGNCLEVKVGAGSFGAGPFTVNNGDSVEIRWKAGVACTGAADGTAITGTLTAGSGGENTYNFTVDTTPTNLSFTDLTNQSLSTAVSSNSITLAGTNVTTHLITTGGTLTSIEASINGGAFAAIPASGTAMPVEPGQTIVIRGTTGAANNTGYTAIVSLGGVSTTWTATTTAVTPSIATPSITSPADGTTDLNPALNSPAGIPLVGSTYTPQNGAGAVQTSSTWEVYKWVGGGAPVAPTLDPPGANYTAITGSPITVSAAPFTTANIPQANLAVSSTYYARVQYATTNASAATSDFSGWSGFATASSFAIPPGSLLGGGYFGGQINDGGTIYNLVVAPVTSGALNGQNGGASPTTIQYKTSASADLPSATVQNEVYGGPTTDLFKASAAHPAFSTFINGASGPNAGAFDLASGGAGGGTGIGGFNDWYLPAKNELEILYFNLKPNTTANSTTSGINPNAVPARASNYTAGNPARTTNALFQSGGGQAFSNALLYWSSTEVSSNTLNAWRQSFDNGFPSGGNKGDGRSARAVRRVSA
jgi:hypothetical protein